MPPVLEHLVDDQDPPTSIDADELEESKPELWPLLLPSQLSQDDRSLCHKGVTETERILRLAQVQDNLVDLRRLRRTLRSLRTYFKSNVIGKGQKTQTKSRAVESGVTARINRTVRHYRLAYSALLSLDPMGDWCNEYLELKDKDNRGPGKELHEQGVGDGRYTMSWIWAVSLGEAQDGTGLSEKEVNETVRHEWMTCRARADRWREESELLQEEMRRVIGFLEWKSRSWNKRVGSRLGSITADVQHGVDCYARKQASTYHELAVSLANQWLPHLLALGLNIAWASVYPWTIKIIPPVKIVPPGEVVSPGEVVPPGEVAPIAEIVPPVVRHPTGFSHVNKNPPTSNPSSAEIAPPSERQYSFVEPVDSDSSDGDESNDEDLLLEANGEGGIQREDEGESSDGAGIGFEYDDDYMS